MFDLSVICQHSDLTDKYTVGYYADRWLTDDFVCLVYVSIFSCKVTAFLPSIKEKTFISFWY